MLDFLKLFSPGVAIAIGVVCIVLAGLILWGMESRCAPRDPPAQASLQSISGTIKKARANGGELRLKLTEAKAAFRYQTNEESAAILQEAACVGCTIELLYDPATGSPASSAPLIEVYALTVDGKVVRKLDQWDGPDCSGTGRNKGLGQLILYGLGLFVFGVFSLIGGLFAKLSKSG